MCVVWMCKNQDKDMISGERCSMKFCTGWVDKYALSGNRLCITLELNLCCYVSFLLFLSHVEIIPNVHICACVHKSFRFAADQGVVMLWCSPFAAAYKHALAVFALLKKQEGLWLRGTNTRHRLGKKTGIRKLCRENENKWASISMWNW